MDEHNHPASTAQQPAAEQLAEQLAEQPGNHPAAAYGPAEHGSAAREAQQPAAEQGPAEHGAGEQPAAVHVASGQPLEPWDQQPGESHRLYARFQVYLQLGPTRTLSQANRATARLLGRPAQSNSGSGDWSRWARRWHWRERAGAWDVQQRQLWALSEHNARLALRRRRIAITEDYLERVCDVLDNAHLDEADQQLAREWLPQMRLFLRDLLAAQRLEYARDPFDASDPAGAFQISADDLRAAQRQLEETAAAGSPGASGTIGAGGAAGAGGATSAAGSTGASGTIGASGATSAAGSTGAGGSTGATGATGAAGASGASGASGATGSIGAGGSTGASGATSAAGALGATGAGGAAGATGATGASEPAVPAGREHTDRTFLVCVCRERGLMLDLAVLRSVRASTGLKFQRLLDPTRRKFAATLQRQRGFGHPIEYVHFALHAAAEGLEFADGPADGSWLSEQMGGVRVALLASCAGDGVGDWLSVVPYVISLSEEIANEEAAALTQHFWSGIGQGLPPGDALDAALRQCPPAVAEYVVRHW